jgi:hypothetical protein
VRSKLRWIRVNLLVLEQEAKKHLSAATVRAWLDGDGRRIDSSTRKRRVNSGP